MFLTCLESADPKLCSASRDRQAGTPPDTGSGLELREVAGSQIRNLHLGRAWVPQHDQE